MVRFALLLSLATVGPASAADTVEFFETKVRPVLAAHCFSCHGEKKQQAGLRLDTADGFKTGTDEGEVVASGKLLAAIKRTGDYPMPPSKPLPADAVADIEQWLKDGAVFPAAAKADRKSAADHWAYKAVIDPPVPAGETASPIDRFVRAKLTEKGLTPSAPADRRTLIRRVHFDLVGLPPTYEEGEAFVADPDPAAYPKLVDRLLASPHYGERWARHWMDVARYADSKGYVFTEDRNYPYAYTYRDYLIRAFNADLPFDRFVREQLAADKLDLKGDPKPLAAMGFLTVGRRFSNNVHDIIDDRIDVVTRGLMGLTVSCARCHDHKFDPLPTADYYSLYAVFASSQEPAALPLLLSADDPQVKRFDAEVAKKRQTADQFAAKMYVDAFAKFRTPHALADYLLAARDSRSLAPAAADELAAGRKLDANMLGLWRDYLRAESRPRDPVFGFWLDVWALPEAGWADGVKAALWKWLGPGKKRMPAALATALAGRPLPDLRAVAEVYGKALAAAADGPLFAALAGPDAPTNPPPPTADKFVAIPIKQQYRKLRNAVDKVTANSPNAPPRAMVLTDAPKPAAGYVFLRGNPANHGPAVPRRAPAVVSDARPFADAGSGRLELADAVVSPKNPLTARVFVNRVWMHHFGEGLVRTPSDFGVRSDPPTHPELLDHLASRFVADGWSVKALHRRILLSETYQQRSDTRPELTAADPENRLLGRTNRRRFDFESLRDGLLVAGNTLDRTVGGRSVDVFAAPFPARRSLYAKIDRQNLPAALRAFDLASPEQHTPQRFVTTVPQQALWLMNGPFAQQQAKVVAGRTTGDGADRVRAVYRAVLARDPTPAEAEQAETFVEAVSDRGCELLAQALLMSNEFAFVD